MESISAQLPSIFNVAAHFLEINLTDRRSERVAFYYQEQSYTYAQVSLWVRRMAGFLHGLGLERENRIAILLPDTPEFVFAFWGAIWLGAVPVPINTACTTDDIHYILQDCRAKVLLTNQVWQTNLAPIESPYLKHIIQTDGDIPLISQLSQQEEFIPWEKTNREEPAFWLYTSGSTGRPKGVIHLHQSMVVCAERYGKDVLDLQEDDVIYSVAKMPFAYGLGNTLYMPMSVGAAAVLTDAANAFDIIEDIQTHQPTVLFGIPGIYAGILSVHEIAPLNSASLRLCLSAAEQLPQTIWLKWRERYGIEICEGIGTTELLHVFLSNRPHQCRSGTSGYPVAGYEVQIVDDQGVPTPDGEIGNLQVSGESLMLGYWNRLTATRKALHGTTMRTGDKYVKDADGYFRFMGRNDDFFKVNGMWVSPFEVEDILLQHETVLDAAVLPSEHDDALTQVIAYVSLKSGCSPNKDLENHLRQMVKSQLPHFKAPKTIHFLDTLPRTSTGKIHRQALLKHAC
ncbi:MULTISPECIES: benzoate-CoA ligase family protein [Pseudanabaena]|uniref:Benzoate-CoA ligase family n=2 Tax=Pseudanabaena TaxID=1152 RepID=L8MYD5_9CYAN|nr:MULTISPECIES: benzoate-CoA ligase family protein [Pseudanabaena]ELS31794.1 benzoate-CoA ligase family [Pseudanabaena biceps PCC 7429]MDG3495962.1 benzoate-CoA ligase family protein [Pseudanabaena catenata USMAC16]